jgi:hypothetical protein
MDPFKLRGTNRFKKSSKNGPNIQVSLTSEPEKKNAGTPTHITCPKCGNRGDLIGHTIYMRQKVSDRLLLNT